MTGNTYYLFEKDLTSCHVSYHFCFKQWENFKIKNSGKIRKSQEELFDIFSKENLLNLLNNSNFHKAITPENKFIEEPYFHMSLFGGNEEDFKQINEKFFISTNYKYNYFTKPIKSLNYPTEFKCGFRLEEFRKITHDLKSEAYQITKLFKNDLTDVIFAFDFTSKGDIINENINIEILPKYSVDNFMSCKNILLDNFYGVDKSTLNKYDRIFISYYPEKFHFHIKIKIYKNKKSTVKIYRTYNSKNPYL